MLNDNENLNDFDHEEDPVLNDNENLNDCNHEEICDVDFVHNDLNQDGSLSECESIFSYV